MLIDVFALINLAELFNALKDNLRMGSKSNEAALGLLIVLAISGAALMIVGDLSNSPFEEPFVFAGSAGVTVDDEKLLESAVKSFNVIVLLMLACCFVVGWCSDLPF
jgi:hypothetical protein